MRQWVEEALALVAWLWVVYESVRALSFFRWLWKLYRVIRDRLREDDE